jgi:hypothetical protein
LLVLPPLRQALAERSLRLPDCLRQGRLSDLQALDGLVDVSRTATARTATTCFRVLSLTGEAAVQDEIVRAFYAVFQSRRFIAFSYKLIRFGLFLRRADRGKLYSPIGERERAVTHAGKDAQSPSCRPMRQIRAAALMSFTATGGIAEAELRSRLPGADGRWGQACCL